MRVLHVIPSISERSGGPAYAIISMCRALQEKQIEVVIATTEADLNGSRPQSEMPMSYKGLSVFLFPAWDNSFKYSPPFTDWLQRNVSGFDLVHIHAVFNHACIAAARACRRNNVPYIVRPLGSLDPWSMSQKSLRKAVFWQLTGKRMLREAAAVHYTALAEQQATEASLGLNHGRIVPLGVDALVPDPAKDSQSVGSDIPGLVGHPYVLVLSRLHPKKGLEVLLDAFLFLVKSKQFENWRLVLAGDGSSEHVATLKAKVELHQANRLVLFPGWLNGEKKDAALRQASLLALPSYHENFGLCVMEALACGIPVLISPHVNLAPDVQAAGAGWIAPVEEAAIRAALANALDSRTERMKRGLAGYELSKKFLWTAIADALLNLYSQILRERNPRQVVGSLC